MKDQKWTAEEETFLKKNYQTMTQKQLADKLNRKIGSIRWKAEKLGLKKVEEREWTEKEIKFLIENYQNMSDRELAKKLNRTKSSILHKRQRLNLRKIKLPPIKFPDGITPQKAYIMGCLCSDGCLYKSRRAKLVQLIAKDKDYVEAFGKAINETYNYNGKVKPHSDSRWRFTASRKKIAEDLNQYLRGRHKKYNWRVPKEIFASDPESKASFVRGVVDGEGTVVNHKRSMGGSIYIYSTNKSGLTDISRLLKSLGIKSNISLLRTGERQKELGGRSKIIIYRNNPKPIYVLYVCGKQNILKFAEKVSFSIKRKRIKLNKIVNQFKHSLREINQYTKKEIDFIKRNYKNMTDKEIASKINHSWISIATTRRKLGLLKR